MKLEWPSPLEIEILLTSTTMDPERGAMSSTRTGEGREENETVLMIRT